MEHPVHHEVDGHRQQRDRRGRDQRGHLAEGDEGGVLAHHRAPVRGRRLDAEAEEGERGDGQEHEAEPQPEFRHQRGRRVRQDLAGDQVPGLLPAQPRRLDVVHHHDVAGHRPREPEHQRRVQQGDHQDEVDDVGAHDGQQQQGEHELRDRHQRIDDAPADLVHPAAQGGGHEAGDGSDQEREGGGEQGDAHRVPCAVDEAAEHVPPELVAAEQHVLVGRRVGAADHLRLAVRRDHRGEHRRHHVDEDDEQAEGRGERGGADGLGRVAREDLHQEFAEAVGEARAGEEQPDGDGDGAQPRFAPEQAHQERDEGEAEQHQEGFAPVVVGGQARGRDHQRVEDDGECAHDAALTSDAAGAGWRGSPPRPPPGSAGCRSRRRPGSRPARPGSPAW